MNEYMSIRGQFCPNKKCKFYQISSNRNVVIHSQKEHRFQCSKCQKTWVAHKDQIYFRLRSPKEKIDLALMLFESGKSVREIAREVKVSPSTVQRWKCISCS
ncbi:helix-turn-helix domain-containing protein [Candidatus Peregrinibacteria bacterium]|nr:helix-turn-helix domain-containing protein [Candidatus Peregrinibacteria bacterium]